MPRKPQQNVAGIYGQELPVLPARVPEELEDSPAAAVYQRLRRALIRLGHVRSVHLDYVVVFCGAAALYRRAMADLSERGTIENSRSGPVQSPDVRSLRAFAQTVFEAGDKLGLPPGLLQALRIDLRTDVPPGKREERRGRALLKFVEKAGR